MNAPPSANSDKPDTVLLAVSRTGTAPFSASDRSLEDMVCGCIQEINQPASDERHIDSPMMIESMAPLFEKGDCLRLEVPRTWLDEVTSALVAQGLLAEPLDQIVRADGPDSSSAESHSEDSDPSESETNLKLVEE